MFRLTKRFSFCITKDGAYHIRPVFVGPMASTASAAPFCGATGLTTQIRSPLLPPGVKLCDNCLKKYRVVVSGGHDVG